jgi:hypothetical protein
MNKYYLYWYHLDTHTDPYTQGYIGITNDLNRRHKEHKYSADKSNKTYLCTHFTNAINMHGGIDNLRKDILHTASYEEICTLERNYRPELNIGWNIAVGGEHPGAISPLKGKVGRWSEEQKANISKHHNGKTISEEHKKALSEKNRANTNLGTAIMLFHKDNYVKLYKFHSISEASRQLDIPLSRLKSKNQRKRTSYGEDGWAILFDPMFDRSQTPTGRQLASKALKGKPKPSIRGENHWKNKTSVGSNDAD